MWVYADVSAGASNVQKKEQHPMKLEAAVTTHCGYWELFLGLLQEQYVLSNF